MEVQCVDWMLPTTMPYILSFASVTMESGLQTQTMKSLRLPAISPAGSEAWI